MWILNGIKMNCKFPYRPVDQFQDPDQFIQDQAVVPFVLTHKDLRLFKPHQDPSVFATEKRYVTFPHPPRPLVHTLPIHSN